MKGIATLRPHDGHCLIVAEVGQAHDGSLGLAHAFIDAIASAGADAVKFQTHLAEAESTASEPWRVRFSQQDATRFAYWKRMEFTEEQWIGLREHADDRGLAFISSPFSVDAVRMLQRVKIAAWKIASGEVGNTPLLNAVAETGSSVFLSSGMSPLEELDAATALLRSHSSPFAVLQCTSMYPCPPEKVGLNMIEFLRARYEAPVGLSDHSGTIYPAVAGALLGLDVVEVHVTLSREMFGPDITSSVTTAELRNLVDGVRFVERIVEHPLDKDVIAQEMTSGREFFTKSIVARRFLAAGTLLTEEDLALKKPGTGLSPKQLPALVGRSLARDIEKDELLSFNDLMDSSQS
jgi:N,N'-diacetyllegionaminate synthase